MAESELNPVKQMNNFANRYGSIGAALMAGVGSIVVTFFGGIALIIDTFRRMITDPVGAIITGVTTLFDVLIGGSADLIGAGVETSVASVAPGQAWAIGPATFALTVLAWGGALYVFTQIMEERSTSNLIPFTLTDVPLVGAEEEGEE